MDHFDSWFSPETKAYHTCFIVLIIIAIFAYAIVTLIGDLF